MKHSFTKQLLSKVEPLTESIISFCHNAESHQKQAMAWALKTGETLIAAKKIFDAEGRGLFDKWLEACRSRSGFPARSSCYNYMAVASKGTAPGEEFKNLQEIYEKTVGHAPKHFRIWYDQSVPFSEWEPAQRQQFVRKVQELAAAAVKCQSAELERFRLKK